VNEKSYPLLTNLPRVSLTFFGFRDEILFSRTSGISPPPKRKIRVSVSEWKLENIETSLNAFIVFSRIHFSFLGIHDIPKL